MTVACKDGDRLDVEIPPQRSATDSVTNPIRRVSGSV